MNVPILGVLTLFGQELRSPKGSFWEAAVICKDISRPGKYASVEGPLHQHLWVWISLPCEPQRTRRDPCHSLVRSSSLPSIAYDRIRGICSNCPSFLILTAFLLGRGMLISPNLFQRNKSTSLIEWLIILKMVFARRRQTHRGHPDGWKYRRHPQYRGSIQRSRRSDLEIPHPIFWWSTRLLVAWWVTG